MSDAPPPSETPRDESPEASSTAPLTKAEKLEAKAAQLREREAARAQRAALAPGGATANRSTRGWLIAVVVLALALLGTVIYAAHEHTSASDANRAAKNARSISSSGARLDALRDSALNTATTVSASFGTYDYKTLTADFARTRAYLTPSFATDFGKLTSTLGSLITQDKGQTVGTVQGAGLESLKPPTAVVLVFLDQKVTTAESSTPRLDHNRLRLTLALQPDGKWLVSKLELV